MIDQFLRMRGQAPKIFNLVPIHRIGLLLLCLALSIISFSQINTTASNATLDPEGLIETIFLGEGVEITNINYDGDNVAVGFFDNGTADIGMQRGLIMSSGRVDGIGAPESNFESTNTSGPNSDSDLEPLTPNPIDDVSRYEISFIPISDTLRFRYVFASEEYPGFNCSNFNDVFGFFITGPNPDGGMYNAENIALVPELSDPSGLTFTNLPVSIANVHGSTGPTCPGSYEEYYNDNAGSQTLVYGAYLDVFTAQAVVTPCEEYTIKLAISDAGDDIYDSSVFLEAKSFGTGSLQVNIETVSLDGSIAEGCNPGKIVISLANPVQEDLLIDAQIISCPDGATKDIDYIGLPDQFIIPAGESSVEYEVTALEDGIAEGTEYICFDIQRDICNRDTVRIGIAESPLTEVFVPNDTVICQSETVFLTSDLPQSFVLPPSPNFEWSGNELISDDGQPNNFMLEVSGVAPDYLTQGMIKSICIDTIANFFLPDVDLYLVTPAGQFMELSTDNGRDGNNMDFDYMVNTCFTPFANLNINNGNPLVGDYYPGNPDFTGDFLPEGFWTDLYGEDRPSNGTYTLLIIDDETGAQIRFTGWSICFNPIYNLEYVWSSDVHGQICINCENVPISVDESTTFYLTTTDSYGCQYVDSFYVEVVDLLPPVQNLMCDTISPDYIGVIWDAEPQATSYEIFIPGVIDPAVDIGNVTEWAVSGLSSLTEYQITVTVIGGPCGGMSSTISCMTDQCEVDPLIVENLEGVSCFGEADGMLDVVITGNYPPFDYEFAGQNNPDGMFDNLSGGEDTLYITDNTGCVSKYPILISEPNVIVIDFENILNITCNDANDGTALADPFGGTPPYDFNWSTGETVALAEMLEEGWNYITVTDQNQCEQIDSIEIVNPTVIQAIHLFQDVDCFGENTGSAIINPTGGTVNSTADYTYAWGDPLNQTTQQAENLPADTYIVTITDLNNCTATEEVVISEPAELITNIIGSPTSCFNTSDGEADLTISGGEMPYNFDWSSGEDTNPATMLVAGMNYVTITDNAGCIKIDSVDIASPPPIEIDLMVQDASCNGLQDGAISWTAMGGTGTIMVEDENGVVINSPFDGLEPREHCLRFIDSEGCFLDTCVIVSEPLAMEINEVITLESCFNTTDAAIDITVVNGVEPFSYEWTGPGLFMSNTEDITNVNSGIYTVTVTDLNMCTAVKVFDLEEPGEIFIDADVFNIACKDAFDGIIQITVQGGSEPYDFNWIGPNGFTSDQEDLIDIAAGTYTLILTDASGCVLQKTYEVIEPSTGITSGISPSDEVCFGAKNGIASVVPGGGTLPYDITWSNGSKFTNLNGLSPGWYYVTIVDGSLCEKIDSVEVVERPEIQLELSEETSLCFESFDGSAQVENIVVDGINQNLDDYTYLWNSFPLQEEAMAVNLKGGQDYLVVVTDALGCTAQEEITVSTPDEVTAVLEVIDSISCALGDDGSLIIEGRGGNSPYDYQWGQSANFQQGAAAKNLKAGTYDVTITDKNGCTGVDEFEIADPFPITLNFRVFDVLCFGEENGEIQILTNGGTPPYDLNWSNSEKQDEISNLEPGEYFITVTDQNDCQVVDSVELSQPDAPLDLEVSTIDVTCADGQDGSIVIDAQGGVGNYIYSLDNFIYNGSVEQIGLSEGIYTAYVKDGNGCIDSVSGITIFSPAPLELELGPDIYISFGESFQIIPTINNFQNPLIYDWSSPDINLLSCDDCATPFVIGEKQATFRLILQDGRGCIVEDFINVYIENSDAVFVPTGFTPNGDFNNDLLNVYGLEGVKINAFRVFDRWGEKVYSAEDFFVNDNTVGWDGMFRGKEMPPGVYTWSIDAEFTNGHIEVFSGHTTLIK